MNGGRGVIDGDGCSMSELRKEKENSQIPSADHWRCHAFLKTVV